MNTTVEYKRPTCRNQYGQYQSKTFIRQNRFTGYVDVSLVWFDGLGWYYAIEIEGWKSHPSQDPQRGDFIIKNYHSHDFWKKGKELALCAEAAEQKAIEMCRAQGIADFNFAPYILPKKLLKQLVKGIL